MAQQQSYPVNRKSHYIFDATRDQSNIVVLIDNQPDYVRSKFPAVVESGICNGYVYSIDILADCPNLPELSFPEVSDGATDMERYAIQTQMEWHSPRFHLILWGTTKANPSVKPADNDWTQLGYHSVINTGTWRQYSPFDFLTSNISYRLQEGEKIGFSVAAITMDGVSYFPRTSPPYSLPENRKDTLTIKSEWAQDLLVAKPDKEPLIIYISQPNSSGTSSTTTTQVAPVVTLSTPIGFTGDILATSVIPISINISKLQPTQTFFLQWINLANNQILKTDTFSALADGTYVSTITSDIFMNSPFAGTGDYKIKVTQGTVAADSNSLSIKCPSVSTPPDNTGNVNVYQYSAQPIILTNCTPGSTWIFTFIKNGVEMSGYSVRYTTPNVAGLSASTTFNTPLFQQWGTGPTNKYKIKATKENASAVFFYSPEFTTYIAAPSSSALG